MEHRIVFGMGHDPTVTNKGIGDTNLKWVVPDRNLCVLNCWIAENIRPIVDVVDLDSPTGEQFGCTLRSGDVLVWKLAGVSLGRIIV